MSVSRRIVPTGAPQHQCDYLFEGRDAFVMQLAHALELKSTIDACIDSDRLLMTPRRRQTLLQALTALEDTLMPKLEDV